MLAKIWPRLEAKGVEVRAEASRALICQARVWDRSDILDPYIAGGVVKTNYGFCKWMERWEMEVKIDVNGFMRIGL